MFTAVFQDSGSVLRKIVDIVKDDIPDATLVAKPDGISLQSMDKALVALIDLKLEPDAADSYVCNDEHHLSVNFSELSKILKTKSSKGVCVMKYDEDKPDILKISFQGDSRKSNFSLKLMNNSDEKQFSIPEDMEHKVEVAVDAEDLQKVFSDLSLFAEDVMITRTGKKLLYSSVGEKAGGKMEMVVGDNFPGTVSAIFSLRYLSWFTKASTLCKEATLAYDTTYPLLLHFQNDTLSLKFFVAAKVNENETETTTNFMDTDSEG